MTDSENDSNDFNYPSGNITVSAKGPNTNISNFSFRNQLTSMCAMPFKMGQQRYAESVYDQRSLYNGRDTSAMSIKSASDMRPRNFRHGYSGMRPPHSVFHGRSGSPMSVRSIDSTASVSVADITFAFKNVKFNEHEMKQIKKAYHELMKQRSRKRIEKRRRLRKFLNGHRRSGDDSGEQGSDSSISSDDCRSIKTLPLKENMSNIKLIDIRRTIKENNMPKESSKNVGLNMFAVGSGNLNNTVQNSNKPLIKMNNCSQKDRFQNGFLLPSQRFNKSVASTVIPENCENRHKILQNNNLPSVKNHLHQNKNSDNTNLINGESEDDEIFSVNTTTTNTTNQYNFQHKRSLDEDELNLPDNKRKKLLSPTANKKEQIPLKTNNNNKKITNNFEFAKPTQRPKKVKPKIPEILIAKSSQPLTDLVEVPNRIQNTVENTLDHPTVQEKSPIAQVASHDQHETGDNTISMRPSFIKRKLFTQKFDLADKGNLSSDGTNSPQNSIYSGISKEKNKTRKLVTTSCLNRDIHDDNNLLDLIHKIVPPDHMNGSNQTSMIHSRKTDANDITKDCNNDKWDVTSVISMCNDDDVSDTFTDEEIFKPDDNRKDKNDKKNINNNNELKTTKTVKEKPENTLTFKDCSIVINKMINQTDKPNVKQQLINDVNDTTFKPNNMTKNKVQNWVKSFWDIDFESDIESLAPPPRTVLKENPKQGNNNALQQGDQEFKAPAKNFASRHTQQDTDNTSTLNNTAATTIMNSNSTNNVQKFDVSNLSVRSHRTSKKKKVCDDACVNNSKIESKSKSFTNTVKSILNSQKENLKSRVSSKSNAQKTVKENVLPKVDEQSVNTNKKKPGTNLQKKVLNESVKSKQNNTKEAKTKPKTQRKSPKNNVNKNDTNSKENAKLKLNSKEKVKKIDDKSTSNKSSKLKTIAKSTEINNSKKRTRGQAENVDNSILSNTTETKQNNIRRDRPVRSCRTPSQNRTMEVSKSLQLSNNANLTRSLRSRIINLSSSIENITFYFKPRSKTVSVQNLPQNKARTSNVSFSLGDQNTPTPKKCLARNKNKRKT